MLRAFFYFLGLFTIMTLLIGCSGAGPDIPDSEEIENMQAATVDGSRVLWGAYAVNLDPENLDATVEPFSREALARFNVTAYITPPACNDCLKIEVLVYDQVHGFAIVRVTLKNPMSLTGYDVRSIVKDYDVKDFIAASGYTDKWTPAVRNPYYCFAFENPDRAFGPLETHSRDVPLHLPPGSTGNATILVDASWPGQCQEPFEVRAVASSRLINDGSDGTKIVAYVFDHQGDIQNVGVDLTPLGGMAYVQMYDDGNHGDGNTGDGIFAIQDITTTVPFGDYDLWVMCKSMGSSLYTYQKARVVVSDVDPYRGDPDYDRIYNETMVKQLNVFISPQNWQAMKDHLAEQMTLPWDQRDLQYFECSVEFEANTWHHVGIRNKGNSSLNSCYNMGIEKLPFRFDFDEYEDIFPETNGQRFWGLKWLVFNNGFKDPSLLREVVTYDLFREFGAVASRSAHYKLFIDFGQGPTYFGLYTTVEVVDNRFVDDRFGDDSGNLYKPEGPGADLTHFVQDTFEKKTNEDDGDWSDVINLIDVLNAPYGDPSQLRTAIEQVLDIESFLNWLVVNSVMCNLDSYSAMSHNYYLYNNPGDDLFYFIPWDCNESFGAFYGTLNADNMPEWDILMPVDGFGYKPLIERILWVPEYLDTYKLKVRSFVDGPLDDGVIHPRMDILHNIARPFVVGPGGEFPPYTLLKFQEDFDINVELDVPPFGPNRILGLKSFLADRKAYIDTVIP